MEPFDAEIDREGTHAVKLCARDVVFGSSDVTAAWVADMDFAAPACVQQALMERASHPIYGYSVLPDSLREAVCNWMMRRHGWFVDPAWLIFVPGAVPALHAALLTLCKPDDPVVIQPPVYHLFGHAVTATGRRLIHNPLREDADGVYRMDLDHLNQALASGARVLLLCSPHNPVGRVWSSHELTELLALARRYGATIVSDEVHHDLVLPGQKHSVLARIAENDPSIWTVVAPSKTFNLAGLAQAALVVPDPARRAELLRTLDLLHMGATHPFSVVAAEAAYRGGAPWLDDLLTYLAISHLQLLECLCEGPSSIRASPLEATYLLWLDLRRLGFDDARLQHALVHEVRAGLSPGPQFGLGGEGRVRFNFAMPRHLALDLARRLRNWADRRASDLNLV